jgi:WD40 repeat protein
VVGTVYGAFTILDLRCRHVDAEACEHRRDLQVGYTWFFDCCGDVLATASEDCKIRLWDLNTG